MTAFRSFAFMSLLSIAPLAQASTDTEWKEIKPGGATTCARGDAFSFFVYPGDSRKVIIDFIGGGACWNAETCAKETATFEDNIEHLRRRQQEGLGGIYDKTRAENPLKNWTHVVIPYCTGDIHWGDATVDYVKKDGSHFSIQHKGAVNTKAVLSWVNANVKDPDNVLVTGCSAGAYGSIYWSPAIRKQFPRSQFLQLGDSGVGVITPSFIEKSFEQWNAEASAPAWIPGLDPRHTDWTKLNITDMYRHIAHFYPNAFFSEFTTAFDNTQTYFYELMGGDGAQWSQKMYKHLADIKASNANFASFVARGYDHCTLPYENFYTTTASQKSLTSWVEDLLQDGKANSFNCTNCDPDGIGN